MASVVFSDSENKQILAAVARVVAARAEMVRLSDRILDGERVYDAHDRASEECAKAWKKLRLIVRRAAARAAAWSENP